MWRIVSCLIVSCWVLFNSEAWVAASETPTVLTFDDISAGSDFIHDGYGGLNWDNMRYNHWDAYSFLDAGTGYQYGAISGTGTALDGGSIPASVAGSPFNFIGAYLTGAFRDGLSVTVTGFRNSQQIYNQTIVTSFGTTQFFEFDFNDVDKLVFDSFGGVVQPTSAGGTGTNFAMDNFAFSPVPEPSTISLLALGAIGLLARRRFAEI
jgi:hypothetical protein